MPTFAEDEKFFTIDTIDGGRSGATFHVAPIDRDTLEREIFPVTLIAYKANNESNATPIDVVIIINDVNDQAPLPIHDEYTISIPEETPQTLNFDKEFGFHDRDTVSFCLRISTMDLKKKLNNRFVHKLSIVEEFLCVKMILVLPSPCLYS